MAEKSNPHLMPPAFTEDKYEEWSRRVSFWKALTTVPSNKQGLAIASSITGKALEAVLQLADDKINCADGYKNVMDKLDAVYKKNSLTQKIEDIESFENLRRDESSTVKEYIAKFEKCVTQLKTHKIEYPTDVQGYKLLKGSNIPPNEEKMIRASCTNIDYESVHGKLKAMYGDEKPSNSSFNLKAEPTFVVNPDYEDEGTADEQDCDFDDDAEDVMYTSNRYKKSNSRRGSYSQANSQPRRQQVPSASNWRRSDNQDVRPKGRNPLSKNGIPTRCRNCQSINHWESKCPDKDKETEEAAFLINEVVLHANDDIVLKALLSETWSCAVLDCGATTTVCGTKWMDEFVSSLPDSQKERVKMECSDKPFRFGDGVVFKSKNKATIPAFIGDKPVLIATEIVDADIPLLLSIKAMKAAKMNLDFDSDKLRVFGQKITLQTVPNGLYALPLTKSKQLMTNFCKDESQCPVVFKTSDVSKTNAETALKLHRSFAHPSADRLLRMVNSAGDKWASNDQLKNEIRKVTNECNVCKMFKKAPSRPTVGLPMATEFNDVVAMDLKMYDGSIILHLIDLCTRLSAATIIPNKKSQTVVKAIFRIWISVYGAPVKFLSDNGGEFANAEFLAFCEKLGITVKTTAAESPWSNGVVERNNQTLARSMDKIIADTKCSLDLALCWALNAKNSLTNVAGFSPFQLVLGTNPRLPSNLSDTVPALTQESTSKLMQDHLNALHAARSAFISCENDERIRRALKSNVRGSGEVKYLTGDEVFYKRDDAVQWHGPGTVIGQINQQVFVKHGSFYVRVHPCRLQLIKGTSRTVSQLSKTPMKEIHTPSADSGNTVPVYVDAARPNNPSNQSAALPINHPVDIPVPIAESSSPAQQEVARNSSAIDVQNEERPHTSESSSSGSAVQNSSTIDVQNEEQPNTIEPSSSGSAVQSDTTVLSDDSDLSAEQFTEPVINPPLGSIRRGMKVKLQEFSQVYEDHPVQEATIVSRAGKASGQYSSHWNTIRPDGSSHIVDFSKVHRWSILKPDSECEPSETDQENQVELALLVSRQTKELEAKHIELDQWRSMGVYKEIPDDGQDCISLRWVVKDKVDNMGNTFCKARLCVRGFEEEQNFRTDSPTCSREGIRVFFSVTAAKGWKLHSMDVKGAFLQGKEIDREVIIRPPKEAQTNKLWKLVKCAYGLADAPRCWYLRIREELLRLGASPSSLDNGIFLFGESELYGIIVLYVDDIMWSGKEIQMRLIITKLKTAFQISHEDDDAFSYVGLQVLQEDDCSIIVNQKTYADSVQTITLDSERMKSPHATLSSEETTKLRGALGQLNWLSNMTRPEISFTVSKLSANVTSATIADIKEANKLIKYVKETSSQLRFPVLDCTSIQVIGYADASFNNLNDGGSQGGQIIFLVDASRNACPVSWRSNRIRRVARSTLAAETLSFADGIDSAQFISKLTEDLQLTTANSTKVTMITDSKSLFDASQTTSQISDRRLRVEMSAIREAKELGEIVVQWVNGADQLADVLTKKGASPYSLLKVLGEGHIDA